MTATVLDPGRPIGADLATTTRMMVQRALRHSLRDAEALVMAIVLPVILMLLFTFVFGGAMDVGGEYVNYVVPGIILLCAGFGASSTAVSVATDLTGGIIDRFRAMPIPAATVIVGHVVASLVRNLVATGIVVGVAVLVGFRPEAGLLGWITTVGLIALYILAITWLFATLGLLARSASAASNYGFVLLFLPYLSSAFVPVDTMPSWLQWVAQHQPITPIIETIRALLMGGEVGAAGWWALGWTVAILVVAAVWGSWLFPRRTAK